MTVEGFTPVSALIGGLLIGTSATMLLLLNGRIAGIGSIAGGLLKPGRIDIAWRACFLVGLVIGAGAYATVRPEAASIGVDASAAALFLGGLLVGYGTQLCGGCTSEHGVCGIARLSPGSIVTTLVFMLSAGATVFVARHIIGT